MRERDTFDFMREREAPRGRHGDEPVRGNDSVRADLVDLALVLRMDKPLAIAVTDPAAPGRGWVWLPKSAIEYEHRGAGAVVVTMPRRLAVEKGLV
ncbi:hypothetical protein RHODGE_RHODGE_02810 [Rhodoplanes serenus]|uniref:Uncharacterized protein n=1 Tax=Rhodoplanes serenus TaxID=200615 RepID=A0A447CWP8_9BRAD|nr:hypothetical protein [Rhodoplanes serenus]VCU09641.1 hypothetical protein RHODGE_RHODGE_02810 [Rhodoplanes serenus]